MIFYIDKLILWLSDGKKRELEFKVNKINVITGESNTGKSAILQIIDYCLFASSSKISDSIINENIQWYGLRICVQGKHYTIARSSLYEGRVTNKYFFSSSGKIPKTPHQNSDDVTIKSLLEAEFGIDRNIKIPFGGRVLKAGSKISLRYFLLFSTISEDIITNSHVYIDKQSEPRYREALPRIFDLAVGIDNIENILKREKKHSLESQIRTIERKQKQISAKRSDFLSELEGIIREAKEYGLIPADLSAEESASLLKGVLVNFTSNLTEEPSNKYEKLKKQEYQINRVIRNLKQLQGGYSDYKATLGGVIDSLKPIEFLRNNNSEIIKTSIYEDILSALELDLKNLKKDAKKRAPIDTNVSDLIHEQEEKLVSVTSLLSSLPQKSSSFGSEREKHFFMGELKAKLELYRSKQGATPTDFEAELQELEKQLDAIQSTDITEKRELFINFFEEIVQQYIDFAGSVLANYENYHPVFDYTEKSLRLRKPLTDYIENVGSSSNHMFMHLFFFLGLHEAIQRKNSRFVPPFLLIDQPSRPYWGEGDEKKDKLDTSDITKIKKAFGLLDFFVDRMLKEIQKECQIIVLEHVPPSTWEGLEHVHLVESFIDGNALIPCSHIISQGK